MDQFLYNIFSVKKKIIAVVVKLIKFCVHQAAKNKIGAPQDLILISAVSGETT